MGAITPQIVMDVESRMQTITERAYADLSSNLWWKGLAKLRTTGARRDVLLWLLSTAQIRDEGTGGNVHYDDLVSEFTEIEVRYAGAGLQLTKAQLTDSDGGGFDLAGQWSADIGAYMAYWPQKQVVDLLKNGHTAALYTAYTKKAFFATDHPLNPFNLGAGTYANLLTGGASGVYPGALPIDDSVTTDVALQNLSKLFSYIASIKQANGEDPRYLRGKSIYCSPRLFPRLVQLTSAKFLAQAAGSSAASGDVEALIKALGFATPVMADELQGFESDTTYFVGTGAIASTQLGAIVYTEREPFAINYYGIPDQVTLGRAQSLEWQCQGRNRVSPGHPYGLIKVKAA